MADESGYAWIIKTDPDGATYFIDAIDPSNSNWMRYVNCPNTVSQKNLLAVT
ncbi:unnamed protein product, partial [Rotaria sp. Silwood2]